MTYREYFLMCDSEEELIEKAKKEIEVAIVLNPDRIKHIKAAVEYVLCEKFSTLQE